MTPATITSTYLLTFDEFLSWEPGTGADYDLIDGVPMPISDPNAKHEDLCYALCNLLNAHCQERQLPYVARLRKKIKLSDSPGNSRQADIVVFDLAEWQRLSASPSPAIAYVPPPLVIEVASTNWRTDYGQKLVEYEAFGIPEFWIVDYAALGAVRYIGEPKRPTLSLYELVEGEYRVSQFRGDEAIASPTLPDLGVTASEVFGLAEFSVPVIDK